MDGRFAERNKNPPRIEWRKLFAEVEADAIAGGTFCPGRRERERKRGRRRKWMVVSSGAEKAEGESEEGKNVAQF